MNSVHLQLRSFNGLLNLQMLPIYRYDKVNTIVWGKFMIGNIYEKKNCGVFADYRPL